MTDKGNFASSSSTLAVSEIVDVDPNDVCPMFPVGNVYVLNSASGEQKTYAFSDPGEKLVHCVAGSVTVAVDGPAGSQLVRLSQPSKALFVHKDTDVRLAGFVKDTVALVYASKVSD